MSHYVYLVYPSLIGMLPFFKNLDGSKPICDADYISISSVSKNKTKNTSLNQAEHVVFSPTKTSQSRATNPSKPNMTQKETPNEAAPFFSPVSVVVPERPLLCIGTALVDNVIVCPSTTIACPSAPTLTV